MSRRVEMLSRGGVRYSPVYWAAIAAALAFLIVDLFDDSAIWNYCVIVCVIVAIAVRPGGVRGRRDAAADEPAASGEAAADEPTPHAT